MSVLKKSYNAEIRIFRGYLQNMNTMKIKTCFFLLILIPNLLLGQKNQKEPKFEIKIEPKMELLSILLNYSYWDYFGKFKSTEYEYYNNMKAHFDKYKEHPTVKWYDNVSKNWNADDPATIILWYGGIPLKQKVPFPLHATSKIDTVMVKVFVEKLNQFAEDTDFMQFWEANKGIYEKMLNRIKPLLPYEDYIKILEDFYGDSEKQFVFILAPVFNGYSFGPQVKNKENTTAYFISGFTEMKTGTPYFTLDYLKMLIFHEFGHSFVNPVCQEYRTELYKYEYFSEYIKSRFLSNYASWFAYCHEHIVRAGESILLEKAGFKKAAEENYKKNIRLGFTLLPFFKEKLEYYDSNKEKYATFKDFFPELLKVFTETGPVKSEKPKSIGLRFRASENGLFLEYVSGKSPLKNMLQKGDIIVSANNKKLKSENDIYLLKDLYYNSKKGNILKFKIVRAGKIVETDIKVPFEDCYIFSLINS